MAFEIDFGELAEQVIDNFDKKYPKEQDSIFKSIYKASVLAAVDVLYEFEKQKQEKQTHSS